MPRRAGADHEGAPAEKQMLGRGETLGDFPATAVNDVHRSIPRMPAFRYASIRSRASHLSGKPALRRLFLLGCARDDELDDDALDEDELDGEELDELGLAVVVDPVTTGEGTGFIRRLGAAGL